MKKSSFVAMLMGTVSVVLFALGMCMALIPEWGAFRPGIVSGCVGLLLGLTTVIVWRKMEHKAPIRFSVKNVFAAVVGVVGALALGIGMCFCMVWGKMVLGIVSHLKCLLHVLFSVSLLKNDHTL